MASQAKEDTSSLMEVTTKWEDMAITSERVAIL